MSNNFSAVGRIGKDATQRQAGSTPVVSISIAVENGKKNQDGSKAADWYAVDFFGQRGVALQQYLTKGTQVFVTGRLTIEKFTDQQGVVQTKPTVNANDIQLLSRPQQQAPAAPQQPAYPQPQNAYQQAVNTGAVPPPAVPTGYEALFGNSDEIPF